MKLREACELGDVCGLETVDEAYANVLIHAGSLFPYEQMFRELDELKFELDLVPDKMISINDYLQEV